MTADQASPPTAILNSANLAVAIARLAAARGQSAEELQASLAGQLAANLWAQTDSEEYLFDPALSALLPDLRAPLARWIAADPAFFVTADHPLRLALDTLGYHLSHWCPRASRPSQTFLQRVDQTLKAVANATPPEGLEQLQAFNHWAARETERAAMLAARLGEQELGEQRLRAAERQVLNAFNLHLGNRPFPAHSQPGLMTVLKSELLHSLVTAGDGPEQAASWRYWLRLLPSLGQVFTLEGEKADQQQLYQLIPALANELERSLELPLCQPDAYGRWVAQLTLDLTQAIQQKPLETSPLEPFAYPEDQSAGQTRVTPALLHLSQALTSGDWLVFAPSSTTKQGDSHGQPGYVRGQLAYKNSGADLLLFVDQAGRKLLSHNFNEMALALSTGSARPLPSPELDSLIQMLLQSLSEELQMRQQQRARQMELAEQQAAGQSFAQQQEARRVAAEKARAEARRLAAQKIRRAQIPPQIGAGEGELSAEAAVARLRVGAWLELGQADGQVVRAKLSVILASTGKYIFVDELGRKLAEFQQDEVVNMYRREELKLLRQGNDFEDQLARVIRSLRKDPTP